MRTPHYAMIGTLNNGKPISEAMYFDLHTVIEQFAIFSGGPRQLHGESLQNADTVGIIHREPLGVVAQPTPGTCCGRFYLEDEILSMRLYRRIWRRDSHVRCGGSKRTRGSALEMPKIHFSRPVASQCFVVDAG